MKVECMSIVITDPCYIKYSLSNACIMKRNTIYGDWSCMTYPGTMENNPLPEQWNEAYFKFFRDYNNPENSEEQKTEIYNTFKEFSENWKSNIIGQFCADSGNVGVFLYGILSDEDKQWINEHPWCATIIKDFNGEVEFEVIDNQLHVIGKSDTKPFFTTQSGF